VSPEAQTQLRTLLAAYDQALDRVASVPKVTFMRHSREGFWSRRCFPTVRLGLNYFLVHHMRRTTNRLLARYQGLAANREESEKFEPNIKRIELFQASLTGTRFKTLLGVVVGIAVLIALPLAKVLFKETGAGEAIEDVASAAMSSDFTGLIGKLFSTDGLWAMAILSLTFYGVVLLPLTAYRWQRILFAVHPGGVPENNDFALEDFTRPAGGIYQIQKDVFTSVECPPVREIPWEQAGHVAALVALLPLWLMLKDPVGEMITMPGPVETPAILAVLFGVIAIGGLFVVRQAWQRRNGEKPRVPVQRSASATATPSRTDRVPVTAVASLWARAVAHGIDSAIVIVIALFMAALVSDLTSAIDEGFLVFLSLPVAAFVYSAPTVLRRGEHRGQTLGKQLVGIRLVTPEGEPVGPKTVVVREALLKWGVIMGIVSVFSLWAPLFISVVWAVLNRSNRAPHDLLSRTIVVYARERSPARHRVRPPQLRSAG
jgi:uncharacterized RDD family membrane protein YckC